MTQSFFVRAGAIASALLSVCLCAPARAQDLASAPADEVVIFQTPDGGLLVASVEDGLLVFTDEQGNGPGEITSLPPKDSKDDEPAGECLYHIFPRVPFRFAGICEIEYDLCVTGHDPLRTLCVRLRFVMCDGRTGPWHEGCKADPRHPGVQ